MIRLGTALKQPVKRGLFEVVSPPSAEVLRKVMAAAQAFAGMPPAAKNILARI